MSAAAVHVAVFDTLADWEIGYLAAHLNVAQRLGGGPARYRIVTVGLTADPVTTLGGLRVLPDVALADVDPADSAVLVLPGGDAWTGGALSEFDSAARSWTAAGVAVAGICGATLGLARAGLLDDRAHASNGPQFLAASGYRGAEHYVDEAAVTDRGIVTGGGIFPVHFTREVFRLLELMPEPVLDAWFRTYAEGDRGAFARLGPPVPAEP